MLMRAARAACVAVARSRPSLLPPRAPRVAWYCEIELVMLPKLPHNLLPMPLATTEGARGAFPRATHRGVAGGVACATTIEGRPARGAPP